MNTTNQDLADAIVRHRLFLLRFEAGRVRELVAAYDEVTRPLIDELKRLRRLARSGGLTALERVRRGQIRQSLSLGIRAFERTAAELVDEAIREAAEAERRIVFNHVRAALPAALRSGLSPAPLVDLLVAGLEPLGGQLGWRQRLAIDLLQAEEQLQAVLFEAQARGLSVPKIARLIKDATGIQSTYRGRLVAIARTEVQRVANTAALETYRANKDVVKQVQYLATLDSRTCLRCAPLHNQVFDLDADGRPVDAPFVPVHPRCRCFYAPVTRSWGELGLSTKEPRLDGKPAKGMGFSQWLKRQPPEHQLEVLGPTRWKAWRSGRFSLSSFSDRDGILTLDELRARYSSFPAA